MSSISDQVGETKCSPEIPKAKSGWQPTGAIDLRSLGCEPGKCQRCKRCDLRFLHTITHPDKGTLQVGCECARKMCYGYAAEREEQRLRNLWSRRSRWLTRNWATSWKGNATLTFKHLDKAFRVTVYLDKFGGWAYCVSVDGDPSYSAQKFATADDAKLGAFDWIAEVIGWDSAERKEGRTDA